eukprot:CFRG3770T1
MRLRSRNPVEDSAKPSTIPNPMPKANKRTIQKKESKKAVKTSIVSTSKISASTKTLGTIDSTKLKPVQDAGTGRLANGKSSYRLLIERCNS